MLNARVRPKVSTTDYKVERIAYAPDSFNVGTSLTLADDAVSSAIPIGFTFNFFGDDYTQFYIGSNGWIGFSPGQTTKANIVAIPDTTSNSPQNAIMLKWSDLGSFAFVTTYYAVYGTAPNRRVVISYYKAFPGCLNRVNWTWFTGQIVLHETTNTIELFTDIADYCSSVDTINYPAPFGVQGLHDKTGTMAITVPERNNTRWRAFQDGIRYTPNGGSTPYLINWYKTDTASSNKIASDTILVKVCPTITTPYIVQLIDTSTQSIYLDTVVVKTVSSPLSTITPGGATIFCQGDSVILTANSGSAYLWSNAATSQSITIKTPGNYTVNVSGSCGSAVSSATTVKVNSLPTANAGSDVTICNGNSITLSGSGGISYLWSPSVGLNNVNIANPVASPTSTITYSVSVFDGRCSAVDSVTVSVLPCDLVWPGDANHDGIANNFDLLAIGVAYGKTGTVRSNASLNWIGQPATDWVNTLSDGTNCKHSDCDGNGTINFTDIPAIIKNYGFTHNKTFAGSTPSSSDPTLSLKISSDTVSSGAAVNVQLELGTNAVPASNVYGIAFTVNFDPTLLDSVSLAFDIANSWLGTKGTNVIALDYNNFSNGSIDLAITKTDHSNTNGYGTIGTLSFNTSNNFTGSKTLNLSVSNVKMISNNETDLPVNLGKEAVITTGINAIQQEDIKVKIQPNPFSSSAMVFIEGLNSNEALSFELYDMLGKKVKQIEGINTRQFTISKENLQSGIYFYKVFSSKEFINTGRVVVE